MNKQILLILVLAVAWTFSGVAAPGPTDPAGADRNAENGAALAPEADTAPAPVDKARLQGRIKQLQATLQNVQNGLRRIDPAGAPPATETDAPPSPDAEAGTDSATDSNAGPETAANQGAEAATPVDPTQLRGQIEQFQAVIEDALRQDVRSAVLSAPKGAYLEDYGAVLFHRGQPLPHPSHHALQPQALQPRGAGPGPPGGSGAVGASQARPPPGPGRTRLPAGTVEAQPHPGRDRPPLQRRGRPPAALPLPVDLRGQGGFGQRLPGGEDHHGRAGPPGADQPVLGKIQWRLASSSDES